MNVGKIIEARKDQSLNRIRTHDRLIGLHLLYQLSYQACWDLVIFELKFIPYQVNKITFFFRICEDSSLCLPCAG